MNATLQEPVAATNRLKEESNIAHFLHVLANVYGSKAAIRWQGSYRVSTLTYRELHDRCLRFVTLLDTHAIRKGDKVCIWAKNSPAWVISFLGCLMAGVVVVPLDYASHAQDAERVARKVRAKGIIMSRFQDANVTARRLYVENLLAELGRVPPKPLCELPQVDGNDLAEIVFTSGTTRDPKGVLITNTNVISTVRAMRHLMPLDPTHRFLSVLPLSHVLEQIMGLLYPLRFGGSVFYSRTSRTSDLVAALRKHGITSMVGVPFLLDTLKDNLERVCRRNGRRAFLRGVAAIGRVLPFPVRRAFSCVIRRRLGASLRLFFCGGAKLAEATEDFWSALGIRVLQGYGMTETTLIVTGNAVGQEKPYTVGKTLSNQSVRVANDGEILVRGSNVTPGYFEDVQATRTAFHNGWLKTGDMGEFDPDGFLRILGRKKDMILTAAGVNIYPQDIEAATNELAQVRESCVVGIEHDGYLRIHAAVIPEPSHRAATEEIVRLANVRLGAHQKIQACSLWPATEFPKTPSMKIMRSEVAAVLRQDCRGGTNGQRHSEPFAGPVTTAAALQTLVAGVLGVTAEHVHLGSRLVDDLGFDSLGLVELIVLLEEWFKIEFVENDLPSNATVGDVLARIESAGRTSADLPRASWARSGPVRLVRGVLQHLLDAGLRAIVRLEVRNRDRLSKLVTPAVFVANHTSHLDSPAVLCTLPSKIRAKTACAAAADYFFGIGGDQGSAKRPIHRILSVAAPLLVNAFPFCRQGQIRESMGLLGELLDDGWSVLIYPEGTRSNAGEMAPFKPGIGLIAAEMGVPIVPVKIDGLGKILPKGRLIPRPGTARITFGTPLVFDKDSDCAAISARITTALEEL